VANFLTAEAFIEKLRANQSEAERAKISRHFKSGSDQFIGVRMGTVFALAKDHVDMALDEIEKLLESDVHEARAGAVSVMAKQFALKKTSEERRGALAALYLRRHDRINNWDLVDLGAPQIVGSWLRDKDRSPLYELARSANIWERRTAMFATMAFIRKGEMDDVFGIAEILVDDGEDLINKVVGGVLREAGKTVPDRLRAFLDAHADTMPRVALRYAIEHFADAERADWLKRGK
jgi:3-methyladenine DNA glycosylase AlkD